MSSVDESCVPDHIVRQSLDWLVRLTSGRVTAAEAQAFMTWRAQSAVHATAFREALELRQKLQTAAGEFVRDDAQNVVHVGFGRPAGMSRRALLGGAIAASAVGLLVAGMQTELLPTAAELTADYRTATGQQQNVAFAHGLLFELNTQTSMSVRNPRAVEVLSGEAAFDAKLPRQDQFSVAALDGKILASDASFNVRNTDGAVCVTCVRGHLTVSRGAQFAELSAGQQVQYTERDWSETRKANVELATAWRSGVVMFHDLALSKVVREVNRYRPGKILVAGSGVGRRRLSGLIQIKRPEAILAQLQSLGVRVTPLPGGLVLVS
ncbi:transmembrane sensor [Rhizomicrobium palustre]|uniref:Transmembrane sensor n=1 Tax=Rhizomicrobium palustre TaxID=189966 RepID=A0A846MZ68_9PROT|nr:DUF4880 domain-containing protein [Rhizomicrobium palustre]NIK88954.1 transmembrane sensor [Rhizomicrobium palustre]